MTEHQPTLLEILNLNERSFALHDLNTEINKQIKTKTVALLKIEEKLLQKLLNLLDLKLKVLWLTAWIKARELQQFTDPQEYPPDEIFDVPLVGHDIITEHNPKLEIRIGTNVVAQCNLRLKITIKIQGINLKIQSGKIKKISNGTYKASLSLGWESFELLKTDIPSLSIPGTIDLGEGVQIPVF